MKERRSGTSLLPAHDADLYRLLVQGVKEYAIFALSPEGIVSSWNEGARRLKGYEADEIIGRHFSVFYPADQQAKTPQELEIALAEGRFEEVGWRVRKDGTLFWANVLITPLYDAHGELVAYGKVTRDLTDQKRNEEALLGQLERLASEKAARQHAERARESAESANEAKSNFLAVMSHELRTPINAIIGYTELLADEVLGPLNDTQRERLARARLSARHLLGLVENVLAISQIEAGKESMIAARVDACALANESAALVAPTAAAKGLRYTLEIPSTPCWIETDATKMRQILTNLLSNAVKFTEAGEVSLTVRSDGRHIQFVVRDTGIGIAPANQSRVFDRFWQVSPPRPALSRGVGLGLNVADRLTMLMGGTIELDSTLGVGTTFTVTFPTAA
jgi:PAS domain S-box-containing protein